MSEEERRSKYPWLPWALTLLALLFIAPLAALSLFGQKWFGWAVRQNDVQTVRWLLRFNPEWAKSEIWAWEGPIGPNVYPYAPAIYYTLDKGNKDIFILLLDAGEEPNKITKETGTSLLDQAAYFGQNELARILIARGVDPNKSNKALGYSILVKNREFVDILLKAGSDPNAPSNRNLMPLHSAAGCGDVALVQRLLVAGADPNAKDASGATPLEWARSKGKSEFSGLIKPDADFKVVQELLLQAIAEREASAAQETRQASGAGNGSAANSK